MIIPEQMDLKIRNNALRIDELQASIYKIEKRLVMIDSTLMVLGSVLTQLCPDMLPRFTDAGVPYKEELTQKNASMSSKWRDLYVKRLINMVFEIKSSTDRDISDMKYRVSCLHNDIKNAVFRYHHTRMTDEQKMVAEKYKKDSDARELANRIDTY